ncbi:VWA domain-containing protein [bacterium]|nr:VWA domain-containing protein [bacterium]
MKRWSLIIILIVLISVLSSSSGWSETESVSVQLAILLDTSNSMDGLIAQAKTRLWQIVNELARVKCNGTTAELSVALFEYGNDGLPAGEGFLRLVAPLTRDLDLISEQLFNLETNGGSEYCGTVIDSAVSRLAWSKGLNDLRMIFIAGNEPFTQGNIDYQKACKAAIEKGIIINTIFCGDHSEGIETKWQHGAELADGRYLTIDHNQEIKPITTPQDAELVRLSDELNRTYLAYGKKGKAMRERQSEQDSNALSLGQGVMAERAVAKSSAHYVNTGWDLVDADKEGTVKLKEMKTEEFPEEMQSMSDEERQAYLEANRQKREQLQDQIQKLNEQRRTYIAEHMKNGARDTLDQAMIKAIHDQIKRKNLTISD